MKTAISIPDEVFAEAERLAKRQKKSRSRLYAEAVSEYLARHDDDSVTEAINKVLADPEATDPELDAFVAAWARRTLERTEWK
jgi:metal-responsive CopG/Arc/MetJ family transcriptional regulator